MGGIEVVAKEVEIVQVAGFAKRNDFYKFMRAYPCLPAPPRPNTIIKFRLADAPKLPLTNSPSRLKPRAWVNLLAQYPGSLRIRLPIVLLFREELGTKALTLSYFQTTWRKPWKTL